MSFKTRPSFGPISLGENITKADIVAAGGTYIGPWVNVPADFVEGSTEATCTAVLEKRHFPMDGDTTSCTVTVAVEGRQSPDGAIPAAVASAAITAMDESNGDLTSTKAKNFDSQDTVDDVRIYPQMRVKISSFSDAGDADAAAWRSSTKHDGAIASAINYMPVVSGTQLTQTANSEYMHVALPASKPIPSKARSTKRLYPVLVVIRNEGTPANSYNLQPGYFFAASPTVSDTNLMIYKALARGWAVVSLAVGGNNDGASGGTFWRRNDTISYTTKTAMDTRKQVAWAIQWLRAFGENTYNLDPDRIVLWGEDDGATTAFWHLYGGYDPSGVTSDLQLKQDALPNLIGGRNPEVDWTAMSAIGGTLRCPIGNAALSAPNNVLDIATINTADAAALTPLRQAGFLSGTTAWRQRILEVPCFVTVGEGDTLRNTSVEQTVAAVTNTYNPPLAIGSITAQRDNIHGYMWAALVRSLADRFGASNSKLVQNFHFNTQGTLPTNAFNLNLVNGNLTTDALANDRFLSWAENLLGIAAPNLGAQAAFNVTLYH